MVELTSRTSTITRQYLERFGRVRVGVYHLVISQQEPFSITKTVDAKQEMPHFCHILTKTIIIKQK